MEPPFFMPNLEFALKTTNLIRFLAVGCLALTALSAQAESYLVKNGQVSPGLKALIAKLPGAYTIEDWILGDQGTVRLVMTSTKDLTRFNNCGSSIGALVEVVAFPNEDGSVDLTAPADAIFQFNSGACSNPGNGTITFHYNRSLFGKDIFLVERVLHNDPWHINQNVSIEWPLRKN
jgi:hypothetical protein